RDAATHRFIDDESPGLMVGGEDEEVGGAVHVGHDGLVHEPEKPYPTPSETGGAGREFLSHAAVTREHYLRGGWSTELDGSQEKVRPFPGHERADVQHDVPILIETQSSTRFILRYRRGCPAEALVVDGVGHEEASLGRNANGGIEAVVQGADRKICVRE